MMRRRVGAGWLGLASTLTLLGSSAPALANGDVQREIRGTVVSVDARACTVLVPREFRGKSMLVTLRAASTTPVLSCSDERATLDRVKTGMTVSVFYEVLGTEGVANLVFIVKYLKDKHPDLKTVMVSYESDVAHSAATWKGAVEPALKKHGYHQILEVVDWKWLDTEMGAQVTKLRKANADIYFALDHTTSMCPSLKELKRQRVKPKMIIGITSLAGTEVLLQCPDVAEGVISPSNFAPITARAKQLADKAWDKYKADSNIHSVPAYENIHLMKGLIEKAQIKNTEDTLLEDRRKIRDLLAKVGTFDGVIGKITLRPEDDPVKPRDVDKDMLLVQVKNAKWAVFWAPPHLQQN